MRVIALLLAVLVPVATSAQSVHRGAAPPDGSVDVLPLVAAEGVSWSEDVPWALVGGLVAVTGAMIFIGVAGEDLGIGCLDGSLLVVGAMGLGILAGGYICGTDAAPTGTPSGLRTASGATYDLGALEAFASDEMTDEQRRRLASAARAAGQDAVVLRRVVAPSTGIGLADAPELRLEMAVLDAETAAWREIGDGPLAAVTRASVLIGDDLEAANTEAMRVVGL